jgi:hypothetical protein
MEPEILEVTEFAARRMLKSLGLEEGKMKPLEIQDRLATLNLAHDVTIPEEGLPLEDRRLYWEVTDAISEGRPVKLLYEDTGGDDEMKVQKIRGRYYEEAVRRVGLDRFGSRLGTKASQINSAINHIPKTVQQIMSQSGVDTRIYSHLDILVRSGMVVKLEDGRYRTPPRKKYRGR